MCAQSAVGFEKQMNPEAHEFLQDIRDKLDVAQVQLAAKYRFITWIFLLLRWFNLFVEFTCLILHSNEI